MFKRVVVFLVLVFSFTQDVWAQCSMCRAIPTSNHNGGGNIANGLNSGIMYLLTIPYILVALLGIYFFRGSIAQWIKDVRYKKKIT